MTHMTTAPKKLRRSHALTKMFSTAFGLGYLPLAPGTWGTFAALPLWWLLQGCSLWLWALWITGFVICSIVICHLADKMFGHHDASQIVLDEVAGMLVASFALPFAWQHVTLAFVLFRAFDMLKPGPIRWIDDHVHGGLGVVLDDVAAGAVACGLVHGLFWLC